MHSTINPALGHGGYEPPRRVWKFRKRTVAQAEPAEADEPPETAAAGSAVTPELVELGEAHFWPHARVAGDLSSPGAVKIVTCGDGVWVYDDKGRRYLDSLSGMWLSNIGHGRREIADAVRAP
jgi:4-aminobutyrate aminotransferase-like enzyme